MKIALRPMLGRRYQAAYNCDSKVHREIVVRMYAHPSLQIRGYLGSKHLVLSIRRLARTVFVLWCSRMINFYAVNINGWVH